jgi:hypothetical protein
MGRLGRCGERSDGAGQSGMASQAAGRRGRGVAATTGGMVGEIVAGGCRDRRAMLVAGRLRCDLRIAGSPGPGRGFSLFRGGFSCYPVSTPLGTVETFMAMPFQ